MKRIGAVVLITMFLAIPASADEFGVVVKKIESHFGIRRTHPFLIGMAMFIAKPAMWGSGIGGLKVALFEPKNRTFDASAEELTRIMASSLGPNWRPFVRVDSRRSREVTVIYADFSGKNMKMLIASIEHDSVAVVRMKVNGKAMARWVSHPADEARNTSQHK